MIVLLFIVAGCSSKNEEAITLRIEDCVTVTEGEYKGCYGRVYDFWRFPIPLLGWEAAICFDNCYQHKKYIPVRYLRKRERCRSIFERYQRELKKHQKMLRDYDR